MTVPLDRLYHYIESVAQDIRGDAVVIYRFYPHGSKKIEDLQKLKTYTYLDYNLSPHIYCNDQEPLDYDYYQTVDIAKHPDAYGKRLFESVGVDSPHTNIRTVLTMFDKVLLLHSEERSVNLVKYRQGPFIPVYYWSHAVISLEWFRYAQHVTQSKKLAKKFLVYNRAWAGSREYRLKFVDLLIENKLHTECQITVNTTEPETNIHYTEYKFKDAKWKPVNDLENYFDKTTAPSYASADFTLEDYEATDFEVVLETLFDDERLHLTEKTLRPIAVGQPFLLVATHGSLEYLKRYGFKTFSSVIDESYDSIEDPVVRLESVVAVMKTIANWTEEERNIKMLQIRHIVEYNRSHFFSANFFNLVINELKTNLKFAFDEQEKSNTGKIIEWRKKLSKYPKAYDVLIGKTAGSAPRPAIAEYVKQARRYYIRNKH